TKEGSQMFSCGPQVIHSATGEKAELAQFATAAAHASVSGNIHIVANDDAHAIDLSKKLMSYLPSNNLEDPPHQLRDSLSLDRVEKFSEIIPENPKAPFDMHEVIAALVDEADFFE